MISNLAASISLLKSAQNEHFYDKLVLQLEKDFVLSNIHFELPKGIPPEELPTFLHEKIYVLLMENFSDYLNLLYVIDVPERAFKEIQVTDAVEVAQQVALLILKRELQKISLRRKYGV